MNIVLIGYRASGKTTIGKLLADQLWKTFVDVDDEICARLGGRTITQIWENDGERVFRDTETQVTIELCNRDDMVIGLGGGTLMEPPARQAVEQAECVRIYLKCAPEVILQRIEQDTRSADNRPNLTHHGGGIDEINSVLAERTPVYEAVADHMLDVSHMKPQAAARWMIEKWL